MVMDCPLPNAMLVAHGIRLSTPLGSDPSWAVFPFFFAPVLLSSRSSEPLSINKPVRFSRQIRRCLLIPTTRIA